MARPEKEAAVQEITEVLEKATSVFVTDFKGLDVEHLSEFRNNCRQASVEYRVVKNTLARIAARNAGVEEMVDHFVGPSAIAYTFDDPSSPARVISDYAKKNEKPTIKVSLFEGAFYGPDRVEDIAALPSKDELLARVVGGLNAPIQGFVSTLNGLLSKFVRTVDAVREQKENG